MHQIMSEREMCHTLIQYFQRYHWDVIKFHDFRDMTCHYKINCELPEGDMYTVEFKDDTMWRMPKEEQINLIIKLGTKIVDYVEAPQRFKAKHLKEIAEAGKEYQI